MSNSAANIHSHSAVLAGDEECGNSKLVSTCTLAVFQPWLTDTVPSARQSEMLRLSAWTGIPLVRTHWKRRSDASSGGSYTTATRTFRRPPSEILTDGNSYQSVCLERAPLVHTPPEKVPFPLNCDDIHVTETSSEPRPLQEPTDASANILRAKVFIVFRKLFHNDSDLLSSYDYIQSVDSELEAIIVDFPWYFQTGSCQGVLPARETIAWQYHMVHSLLCMQRIRMHRPFLQQRMGTSWEVCAKSASEVLSVYKVLRTPDIERLRRSQKFYVQGYQIYSAAIAQAAFLLVEQTFPVETLRQDVEMVISDLSLGGLDGMGVSTMKDGKRILRKMLDMYDRGGLREPLESESLVPEISAVFGGEQTTRRYLNRCEISYVLNENQEGAIKYNPNDQYRYTTQTRGGPVALSAFLDYYGQSNAVPTFDITNGDHWDYILPDHVYPV